MDPVTPATQNPQAPVAPAQTPAQAPVKPVTPPPVAKTGEPAAVQPQQDKTVPISALLEEREKRQQLQQQIEQLRATIGQNVLFDSEGRPVQYQQPPQPQANRYQQEMEKLWETDPRKAVQAEIYQAMAWRDQQDAELDRQESEATRKYTDFNNYRNEIRQYVRTLPMEQRSQRGIVDLAYYVVRGQKVDNIIATTREQIEAEVRAKLASGQGYGPLPTGSSGEPPAPQPGTLTEDEKKAADMMGVPHSDYARYKKM